jgi:hypothetical protein
VTATMLADRSRWKREQSRDRDQLRRESYGAYLAALVQAHEAMRAAAEGGTSSPASRPAAITEAFQSANPYVRRFELSLVAPGDVVTAAVAAFRSVRAIRDLLTGGVIAESAEYRQAQREYYDALKAMLDVMRQDLATTPLGSSTIGGALAALDDSA